MSGNELLTYSIDSVGYQLDKVLEGMPAQAHDKKLWPSAMSPRETLGHLAEAYQAFLAATRSEKYEWGSLQIEDGSWEGMIGVFKDLRSQASRAAADAPDDKAQREAIEYIVVHDAYHVGQLAACRIECEPSWDPYSIYKM